MSHSKSRSETPAVVRGQAEGQGREGQSEETAEGDGCIRDRAREGDGEVTGTHSQNPSPPHCQQYTFVECGTSTVPAVALRPTPLLWNAASNSRRFTSPHRRSRRMARPPLEPGLAGSPGGRAKRGAANATARTAEVTPRAWADSRPR
jgi:hypothetical protein